MVIDFKKIIAWLKRNKIGYTIKDNSIVLFNDSNGKVELVFNPDRITPKAPRGVLMPSSAADDSEFYVKVGDWGKWIDEFLAWAKDRGYYEYNHYRNSQWGTWKFGNFISMSFFGVFIKKIITLKNGVNESMKLYEAKQILNKEGYILEDTETLDDEIDYLKNQNSKASRNKLNKAMERVYAGDLEKKVLNAQNYNIEHFYAGLEEKFDKYWENYTVDHMFYDTEHNFQPTSYWFDDGYLEFQVDYFDEKGVIDVGLIDIKKGTRKNKKFKITKTDENIEEVFDWFFHKVENYDQRDW